LWENICPIAMGQIFFKNRVDKCIPLCYYRVDTSKPE